MAEPMVSASRSFSDTVRGAKKICVNSTATARATQAAKTAIAPIAARTPWGRKPNRAAQARKPSGT
jgi:hypothetical protein